MQLPSIYGEHLPDEIRYRRADGQDVVVPLDVATVDELAFASRRPTRNRWRSVAAAPLEELHTEVRKRAARGPTTSPTCRGRADHERDHSLPVQKRTPCASRSMNSGSRGSTPPMSATPWRWAIRLRRSSPTSMPRISRNWRPHGGWPSAPNHVNESGLYALILGSTKDAAKRFKRWITGEVLPAIRKTGAYSAATTMAALPAPTKIASPPSC